MIAQELTARSMASVTLACSTRPLSRMYALRPSLAPVVGVATLMRDVVLWGFTVDFFTFQPELLAEVETAMKVCQSARLSLWLAELDPDRI